MKIYADHAATTKMSDAAVNTLLCMSKEVWGNPSSLYEHGQKAKEVLEQAREDVASVINADPKEIYFTSGGSEADNQAILTAAEIGRKQGKKHIISSAFEHHAVLHTLEKLRREGFDITLLDVHENGIILPCEVEDAIRDDTCLVTIMYANNEIGTIQPIREIGAVCRRKKVLFHTDAVQAVAHIPVDVKADNIDMLSSSAHKFHGPKGTGFLYCKKGIQLSNLIEGGAQERGKRAGTENVPGIAAMATALKEMDRKKMPAVARLTKLRDRLIEGLQQIPHSALNGDAKHRLPGNVNFCFEGIEGESLLLLLDGFLRKRVYLRLPGSEPRPAGHRQDPRCGSRFSQADTRGREHGRRGGIHHQVRERSGGISPRVLTRLERADVRGKRIHSLRRK